jgi:hypothetical protein
VTSVHMSLSFFLGFTLNSPTERLLVGVHDSLTRLPQANGIVLTIFTVDVDLEVEILIFSSAARPLAAAPAWLLA